jgi:hypothetical protein
VGFGEEVAKLLLVISPWANGELRKAKWVLSIRNLVRSLVIGLMEGETFGDES